MTPQLKPGDRVILEIKTNEVYEGTINYISSRSIELSNIFCQSLNVPYDGNMTFYCNELATRPKLISKLPMTDSFVSEKFESKNHENCVVSEKILMHPEEFQRLKQMSYDYKFIDTFGKQFNDAVEVLSNRESVAVVGLGNTFSRGKGLSLLVMADFKQVYIFDLFCLVDLKSLKDILESNFICKVVHDGTALYDCLFHKYKVEMKNIFDTKIVDPMINSEKSEEKIERDISKCLTHYFNFPPSLLSAAIDDMRDKIWLERPVVKGNQTKAAQLVVYLLSLRDELMAHILRKYSNSIQEEYTKYKKIKDADLLKFTIK